MGAKVTCTLIEHGHRAYLFERPDGHLFALEISADAMREDSGVAYRFAILNADGLYTTRNTHSFAGMKRQARKLIASADIPEDFTADTWLVDIARQYAAREFGGASYTAVTL